MKDRITLTLDTEILKRVDQSVDGFHIKNRSHAIELLLLKAMRADIPQHAIILAAGMPLQIKGLDSGPVGMLRIHNRPIIEHLINMFRKYNTRDILLGVCYDREEIKRYFGNGSRFGVRIRYIEEDHPSGTISIVKKAKPFLSGSFFVTNSDELKDVNLSDMYAVHRENNASVTIALTTVKDPMQYGVVMMDGNRIRDFSEKPQKGNTNMINAGLYLMELDMLEMIPADMKMFYELFPMIAGRNRLVGYPFSGQWFDISSAEKYREAERDWRGL